MTDWTRHGATWVCAPGERAPEEDRSQSVYHAMMLGLRDYVNKNRFPGVVLGMSGGIDSALSAAVAVDALGPDRVRCVMLPSKYTSKDSLDDAAECSKLLGVKYETVPIESIVDAFTTALAPTFAGKTRRHDGGEHPVARPWRDPDGDLQQVRPDGADHRQQERDERRLRHALRRHVRRLQRAEGRLQDGGLPPRAVAQPGGARAAHWGRPAASFQNASSPSRPAPSCATTRRTRIRCRPTTSSTASSNVSSRTK